MGILSPYHLMTTKNGYFKGSKFWHALCKILDDSKKKNFQKSEASLRYKSMKKANQLITGIVVAAGWDDDGNVALISIQGYDEREYVVKMNRCGNELMDLINQKVKVSGNVSERLDGKLLIQVGQYDLI